MYERKEDHDMAIAEQKIINGVEVEKLEATVNAIKEDPGIGNCKFRLHNEWIDGAHNHSNSLAFYAAHKENEHLRKFEWDADEPPLLAGKDLGANPVEHLLNALAACVTTTIVYYAAIKGIKIEKLESHLEGELDLRGLFGISSDVRPGFRNITIDYSIRTDEKNLDKLKAFSKFSPVFDMTSNGTSIEVNMTRI
jgi:uncharacterized OsmC-like protein